MKEFKGTKGKWLTEISYDKEYDQPVININNDKGIESFITVWSGSDKLAPADRANAKLISKAPEMLAMLIEARDKLSTVNDPVTSCRMLANKISELIKQATEI